MENVQEFSLLPSGTVTFLFTDIESSTRLWEEYPDAATAALAWHDAAWRQIVESHNGHIIKTTGDGLHAVFATAADALQAVVAGQLAMVTQSWPEFGSLRVRLALHSGEAEWRDGDYYGSAVNRAARLMSLASGGQILLSAVTARLVSDHLPPGVSLVELGRYHLESLDRPERIFQLHHPDLPADFPPLASPGAVPNNLPTQLTTFVGREGEAAQLVSSLMPDLVDQNNSKGNGRPRLVSLIGPGGTGKTRLSLETAGRLLPHFPDGVWFIELATIADPQLVVQTVAAPLNIREQSGRPLLAMLDDYLRRRQVLLILDNCEHLIDECARLAGHLLQACPDLRLLASSREALGIPGETILRVRSLALPPEGSGFTAAELEEYDAIHLFLDRAKTARPDFALTSGNAASILQICRRLDGIPLAIELAAARVRVLVPEQIAARLDDRFRLLTGGSRTALPRQRTLQALIDWSYDLLSEPECILLRRLAVFSGGWSLEAAEAVTAVAPIEPYEVLDLLEQLVNKSLVLAEEGPLGMRYRFLETIRQYAQEKLAESGESEAIRDRHLAYFEDLNSRTFEAIMELRDPYLIDQLAINGENLRLARAWALEHDRIAALNFAGKTYVQWNRVLPAIEGLRFSEEVLALVETDPAFSGPAASSENRRLVAAVRTAAAGQAFGLGLNQRSLDEAVRGVEIAQVENDSLTLALASQQATLASAFLGDVQGARRWRQKRSVAVEQANVPLLRAMVLISSVNEFFYTPDLEVGDEDVWANWQEGMALLRQGGERWGQALGHWQAANNFMFSGDAQKAQFHAERSLELFNESSNFTYAGIPTSLLAALARQRGDLDQAEALYREVAGTARDGGNLGAASRCLECLAFIAHARARASDGAAQAAHLHDATLILGATAAIRQAHHSNMTILEQEEYDAEIAAIRALAGDEAFEEAWREGQSLNVDQAVAFVQDREIAS